MDAIRFNCNGHNAPAYGCSKPGDNSGEYYHKPEADAEIAKRDHQIEVLNSDLTRCQEAKAKFGDKILRLEGEVERLTESLRACIHELQEQTNAKEEILRIAKQVLSGGR